MPRVPPVTSTTVPGKLTSAAGPRIVASYGYI
jgi:hypothetical protein